MNPRFRCSAAFIYFYKAEGKREQEEGARMRLDGSPWRPLSTG